MAGPEDVKMTLTEHLDELRSRIIYSLAAVAAIGVGAYFFRFQILKVLTRPLRHIKNINNVIPQEQMPSLLEKLRNLFEEGGFTPQEAEALTAAFQRVLAPSGLIFIHPTEAFFSYIKLSFFTGLLIGAPFVIYQLWKFILPALFKHERRYLFNFFTFGTVLFFCGVVLAFLGVLPLAVGFLVRVGGPYLQPTFTVGNYISFSMILMLAFGMIFELPVAIFLLVKTGITSREFLRKKRRYVLVLAFISAAILTPPDIITQIFMALPIILLYEVSIWVAKLAERKPKTVMEAEIK
jgi:sec-independent protein translocase protein TatC